jgi:asparagine synthase (glutamine-hydrolysing)
VLRRLGAGLLPKEILERPKVGFRVPLDRWFRAGLRDLARDTLLSRSSFVTEVFDRTEIEQLLERHERNRFDENIRLWTLLSLEMWHEASFIHRPSPVPGLLP